MINVEQFFWKYSRHEVSSDRYYYYRRRYNAHVIIVRTVQCFLDCWSVVTNECKEVSIILSLPPSLPSSLRILHYEEAPGVRKRSVVFYVVFDFYMCIIFDSFFISSRFGCPAPVGRFSWFVVLLPLWAFTRLTWCDFKFWIVCFFLLFVCLPRWAIIRHFYVCFLKFLSLLRN